MIFNISAPESDKAYPKLVLLSVDNDRGDLLVHEQEDGQQEGRDGSQQIDVPGINKVNFEILLQRHPLRICTLKNNKCSLYQN